MPEHPDTRPTSYADTKSVADLAHRFTYHPPKADQAARYLAIRSQAQALGSKILVECPPGRERSLALTNLEQAVMWANAAIARGEATR